VLQQQPGLQRPALPQLALPLERVEPPAPGHWQPSVLSQLRFLSALEQLFCSTPCSIFSKA
jgi:hypothetical protein